MVFTIFKNLYGSTSTKKTQGPFVTSADCGLKLLLSLLTFIQDTTSPKFLYLHGRKLLLIQTRFVKKYFEFMNELFKDYFEFWVTKSALRTTGPGPGHRNAWGVTIYGYHYRTGSCFPASNISRAFHL